MRQRFFTISSAIAFLAFVAILFWWLAICLVGDRRLVVWHLDERQLQIELTASRFSVSLFDGRTMNRSLPKLAVYDLTLFSASNPLIYNEPTGYGAMPLSNIPDAYRLGVFGFAGKQATPPNIQVAVTLLWIVTIPTVLPVALSGLPVLVMRRHFVRILRRFRGRRCLKCAYDLTGNSSGVCPECGTPVASSGNGAT